MWPFCNRYSPDVPILVAGPEENSICSDCAEELAKGILEHKKELNNSVTRCFGE